MRRTTAGTLVLSIMGLIGTNVHAQDHSQPSVQKCDVVIDASRMSPVNRGFAQQAQIYAAGTSGRGELWIALRANLNGIELDVVLFSAAARRFLVCQGLAYYQGYRWRITDPGRTLIYQAALNDWCPAPSAERYSAHDVNDFDALVNWLTSR